MDEGREGYGRDPRPGGNGFLGRRRAGRPKLPGRLGAAFLIAAALLSALMPAQPARAAEGTDQGVTINVYNWGEYIANGTDGSLDINAEFTRRTGIRVNYTTFDSNESLYSKLVGGGAD